MFRLLLLVLCASVLSAQDGATIYKTHCAVCHDAPVGRVPPRSALNTMSANTIMAALETGSMKAQGAGLSVSERRAVASYFAAPEPAFGGTVANSCAPSSTEPSKQGSAWTSWGANAENTRFQSAEAGGFTAEQLPKLRLKWAFNLGGVSPHSQPSVAFGKIFVGGADSKVYALDASTGCTRWVLPLGWPVRSGIAIGEIAASSREPVVFFGARADVYAVNAVTGKLLWRAPVDEHPAAMVTGTPALHNGVLYVPVSSYEEALAASPKYPCCSFRGSVVAFNAVTGKQIWKTYTIPDTGRDPKGPSGGAVWSTPTFDEKRQAIYVATGDNYSDPPSATSDAVLALNAQSGKLLWSQQATHDDVYNMGCDIGVQGNCPPTHGHDFDFGQPPILVVLQNGRRALVIAQKSGLVHAFDPDDGGKPLWSRRVSAGSALGGSEWGSAAAGDRIYVAASDIHLKGIPDSSSPQGYRLEPDPTQGGGLFALDPATGNIIWSAKPPVCGDRRPCSPAQSAPVSAIPGAALSGAYDGHLRAYSAATGDVIWDVDTAREYDSVNGGKARGGSLDVTGPVIAGGMLYLTSGYAQWGGIPGNVLLAYSVNGL